MRHPGAIIVLAAAIAGTGGLGFAHPFDNACAATLPDMRMREAPQAGTGSVGNAARGKMVFEKRCTACHAIEGNREGPPLASVFNRQAGSFEGFDYSVELKKSGITWNDATLEKWLADPDIMVPGNNMGVRVVKAQERLDLIAYLKQQK